MGPIELVVIGFPGGNLHGEIAPLIRERVENGTVRVIDLVFISKDEDGSITGIEVTELDEDAAAAYADVDGAFDEILSDEDLQLAAQELEPGDSALLMVWEDVWAAGLADAVMTRGAVDVPTTSR